MILTNQLMNNINSDQIIPVIRNNETDILVPTFLSTRLYADFRDDGAFEAQYANLLRSIHGVPVVPRPQLGLNPFTADILEVEPRVSFAPERYTSATTSGTILFDYSNNDGSYVLGAGDYLFQTKWSRGSSSSIYAYTDPPSIRSVALAIGASKISEIKDARVFDTASRVRSPHLNEIVIWQNTAGYYLATQVLSLKARGYGHSIDEITFKYAILPNKRFNFTSL
ncbi:hypothetical protein [Kiloniella sp.]|uniref:hypothetical protein n=1 Tax=Kiloniella sp. TaxID=1938587 RepID=UPI003B014CA5